MSKISRGFVVEIEGPEEDVRGITADILPETLRAGLYLLETTAHINRDTALITRDGAMRLTITAAQESERR